MKSNNSKQSKDKSIENQNEAVKPTRLQDLCIEDKQKVGDMIKKLSTLTADNEDLQKTIRELTDQLYQSEKEATKYKNMYEDLANDQKSIETEFSVLKETNESQIKIINDQKKDNMKLRLHTDLNVKETKSIKTNTEKWMMNKSINQDEVEFSPDKFSKSMNNGNLSRIHSSSSTQKGILNNSYKVKKNNYNNNSNANENFNEFKTEIMSIMKEMKQFPQKMKKELVNEIISEVNNSKNSTENQNKSFANSSLHLNNQNINKNMAYSNNTSINIRDNPIPITQSPQQNQNTPNYNDKTMDLNLDLMNINNDYSNSLISTNEQVHKNINNINQNESKDMSIQMNNIKQSIKSFTERRKDVEEKINRYLVSPSHSAVTDSFQQSKIGSLNEGRNRVLHPKDTLDYNLDRELIFNLNENNSSGTHQNKENIKLSSSLFNDGGRLQESTDGLTQMNFNQNSDEKNKGRLVKGDGSNPFTEEKLDDIISAINGFN